MKKSISIEYYRNSVYNFVLAYFVIHNVNALIKKNSENDYEYLFDANNIYILKNISLNIGKIIIFLLNEIHCTVPVFLLPPFVQTSPTHQQC